MVMKFSISDSNANDANLSFSNRNTKKVEKVEVISYFYTSEKNDSKEKNNFNEEVHEQMLCASL